MTEHNRHRYLLNIPFILGLFILLLNDHCLKAEFGNWWTGKLSDFAGVLILPFFIQFLFNKKYRIGIISTAILFCLWKSPAVTPLIDAFNSFGLMQIGRVVDYTDLLALIMLPVSWYILAHISRFELRKEAMRTSFSYVVFFIATAAFVATSDDPDFPLPGRSLRYCCDMAPVDEKIGNETIFIPNIFSPNNDGLYDLFDFSTSAVELRVDTFLVFDLINQEFFGEDRLEEVFSAYNVLDQDFDGWDGTVNGQVIDGRYAYRIVVTDQGLQHAFEGHICSVSCTDRISNQRPLFLDKCVYGIRFEPNAGIFTPDKPTFETLDCFE